MALGKDVVVFDLLVFREGLAPDPDSPEPVLRLVPYHSQVGEWEERTVTPCTFNVAFLDLRLTPKILNGLIEKPGEVITAGA